MRRRTRSGLLGVAATALLAAVVPGVRVRALETWIGGTGE